MESNDNDNNPTPVDLDEHKLAQLERDPYGVMNPEHIGRDANFNILSALPPADTDASEFVEYGSANDDAGGRETPIVVDDDAASAASSETLRADMQACTLKIVRAVLGVMSPGSEDRRIGCFMRSQLCRYKALLWMMYFGNGTAVHKKTTIDTHSLGTSLLHRTLCIST
ncbi:unnamed protein product, partial [Aureobasidium pullulans]